MIDEQGKGELKLILTLFICMASLLGLLLIAGQMETNTGERRISSACAAQGGEDECESDEDCPLDCQKCEDGPHGSSCVDDCPVNESCDSLAGKCICPTEWDCSECSGGFKICEVNDCSLTAWLMGGTGPFTIPCGRPPRPPGPPIPSPPRG